MLETIETMYMSNLNYIGKNNDKNPNTGWFNNITEHLKKKLFIKRTTLYDTDIIKLRQHIAILFTIYDLFVSYPENFRERLIEECDKCGISIDALIAFRKHYEEILTQLKKKFIIQIIRV